MTENEIRDFLEQFFDKKEKIYGKMTDAEKKKMYRLYDKLFTYQKKMMGKYESR